MVRPCDDTQITTNRLDNSYEMHNKSGEQSTKFGINSTTVHTHAGAEQGKAVYLV